MVDQTNRGVAKVLTSIVDALPAYATIQVNEIMLDRVRKTLPHVTEQSLVSGLSYLKNRGVLRSTEIRGVYAKPNGKAKPATPADMELVVIDNLLNAMAEAEPVLKQCKKVIAALRDFK